MGQIIRIDDPALTARKTNRDPRSYIGGPRRIKHQKIGLALSRLNPACAMSLPYNWRKAI